MLSAGFCHLLADAHTHPGLLFVGKRFPMANFLAASGYILTLVADQVVQQITDSQAAAEQAAAGSGTANGDYSKLPNSLELASAADGDRAEAGTLSPGPSGVDGGGQAATLRHTPPYALKKHDNDASSLPLLASGGANGAHAPGVAAQPVVTGAGHQPDDCHAGVAALLGGRRKLSFATAVLLASALCIHSVLEGMALGAQSSMRSTEDIMIAIAAHKGLAAYALGASIVESGAPSSRFWTVIGFFSMATPVGIFVGFSMSTNPKSLVGAALSALASGTFLYVAFMEVIPKELADGQHRMAKMAAFLIGFLLMSLLAIWA